MNTIYFSASYVSDNAQYALCERSVVLEITPQGGHYYPMAIFKILNKRYVLALTKRTDTG